MQYVERPVHPLLRPYVECLWCLEAPAAPADDQAVDRVIPDGCMELILHWGDRYEELDGTAALRDHHRSVPDVQPRALVAGQRQTPLLLRGSGRSGITAARFRPGGSAPFLHERADALAGQTVDLAAITPGASTLLDEVASATDAADRMDALERWLIRRLRPVPSSTRIVDRAVEMLLASDVLPDGSRLARLVGCSRRTLERRFRERVGLGPMALRRILRLQSVFLRHQREPGITWSETAVACGYFDQAHLVRDFRQYTGLTPTAWAREQHAMSDLFTQADRLEELFGPRGDRVTLGYST